MKRHIITLLCFLLFGTAAQATVYYVDGSRAGNTGAGTSWATAKKDVQAAINAAAGGDEVWVKAGTYLPTLDPNGGTSQQDKTFYLTSNDIRLYGGFAGTETLLSQRNAVTNVTTLSGDLDGAGGTVDAYHVLLTLGRTSACVVDGFTITGGRANAGAAFAVSTPSARVYQNNGAGMNNISGSPTVSNCTFISNTASYGGGGIYNSNSVPIVSGCVFASNMAVYGGGMYHDYNSGSTISNCVFTSNVASNSGGAIHNEYVTYLTITNSTFFSNTATTQGGALYYNANAGGSVTNCILYGSTSSGTGNTNRQNIYKAGVSNSPLTVSYSRIGDYSATATNNYTSGAGIITSDPLFLNAGSPAGADGTFRTADDGFRISCTSPARNAGTGATPVTDILGNPRIGVPDLGAYEADATCLKVVYVNGSQPDNTGDGLTWTTAKKDVQAAINVANSGDTIWVKGGTYLPTLDPNGGASQRDKTFYLTTKDVKLYGGFSGTETAFSQRNAVANVTTLSGDLDGAGGTVDAYHVLLTLNRTSNCVVDGFTITGGRANGTGSFAVSTPSAQVSQEIGAGMYNTSSSPTVSNCTFASNAANHGGAGLYNSNSSPTVSSCTFSSNTASYGGGMYNINASNPMVNSCVFSANAGGNVGGGMYTLTSSPTVSNSIFTANTAYLGGAMYTVNSSLALGNCTFAANTASGQGGGLYFTTDGGGSITNCILYGNTGGSANQQNISKTGTNGSLTVSYSLIGDYSPTATNNYNSGAGISTGDPLFVNAASPAGADGRFRTADDGLIIKGCSPARDAGTGATPTIDILGNPRVGALDLGAYETNVNCPKVYYVNGSQPNNNGSGLTWATAKKDLQAAINVTGSGDTIWVKAGTYFPTLDPNGGTSQQDKTFYLTSNDISLYGGFAGTETLLSQRNAVTNVTTLSGDLDGAGGTVDAYHVLLTLGRTSACVVDGFTITGGRANGAGSLAVSTPSAQVSQNNGGGMNNGSFSSPTISNCTFTSSTAGNQGGGMYNGYFSRPTISNCTFTSDTAGSQGGGMYNYYGGPTVSSCTFSSNTAGSGGGGMYNEFCNDLVSNCTFVSNKAGSAGGGMYNSGNNGNTTVSNCIFSANTATTQGGGMYIEFCSPEVSTCVFTFNTANTQGGGIAYNSYGSGSVTNSIFYGNTGGPANRQNLYKAGIGTGATLIVSYSLIGDYSAGATNNYTSGPGLFAADPRFVNSALPAGADGRFGTADDGLALQLCSPAINAGTGTTPATDLSGNSRIGIIDLGAYEYQGTPSATLAGSTTTDNRSLQSGSALGFGTCGAVIASLSPSGAAPVTGSIAAKVYVQPTAPSYNQMAYVRRYYDITPATNPNTATAQITLYFSQADFTDYNTVRGSLPPLPLDATDAANNKGNLRITQEHGTSATGLPGSYSGWSGTGPAKVLITPTSVSWNTTLSRWEVLFPVTGFSGFFATSALNGPLPVELLHFSARRVGESINQLDWTTGAEEAGMRFRVERSSDAKTFTSIGAVSGKGPGSAYRFMDAAPLLGDNYYRLQVPAVSGEVRYSQTVLVKGFESASSGTVVLAPNPATDRVTIVCTDKALQGSQATIWSAEGRLMHTFVLERETTLDVHNWAVGVYLLRIQDGSTLRLIKN